MPEADPDPTVLEEEKLGPLGTSSINRITNPLDKYNPFENAQVKTYSHKSNIVPPYVLDKLSQVHYKEQLNNTNTNTVDNNTASSSHRHSVGPQSLHSRSHSYVRSPSHPHSHSHPHSNPNTHPNSHSHSRPHSHLHSSSKSKSETSGDEFLSFTNDPFVKSLGGNWHNFLHTVQQPNVYTQDVVTFDSRFNSDWKLEGNWGGEERLKHALLGALQFDEDDNGETPRLNWFSRLFQRKSSKTTVSASIHKELYEPSPRVRSKAGYWMSDEKRADLMPTLQRIFLQNPLIPLLFRILIIIFSIISLSLAVSIFVISNEQESKIPEQPSTIMAIIVQCLAIVYLTYIAYDEYHGKPLGLRDPTEKMKLILLDLLFIIMSLANLSLTFNTLYDPQWVCTAIPDDNDSQQAVLVGYFYPLIGSLCRRQRALLGFLLLALFLWVLTFTISILRVVDRVSNNPRLD